MALTTSFSGISLCPPRPLLPACSGRGAAAALRFPGGSKPLGRIRLKREHRGGAGRLTGSPSSVPLVVRLGAGRLKDSGCGGGSPSVGVWGWSSELRREVTINGPAAVEQQPPLVQEGRRSDRDLLSSGEPGVVGGCRGRTPGRRGRAEGGVATGAAASGSHGPASDGNDGRASRVGQGSTAAVMGVGAGSWLAAQAAGFGAAPAASAKEIGGGGTAELSDAGLGRSRSDQGGSGVVGRKWSGYAGAVDGGGRAVKRGSDCANA
ncbi:keratin, type I cytoskeletal 9-like [Eucalyptus grandis]|uniref:keratin, type I cytoskeletal 9-like n=1 Tax=Eucalyptus grandis TaxID=71139 RepID=UPI00192EF764|nr:keratin, type I cytoskeletal 9-like [Eucalyptus grandis]